MPRAIIKNPVGNVGDVREDVKILLSYENDVQYFDMTLSKKNENYSARFHYEDGVVVVDSVEGGQYSTELSEKLNYLDDIIAITNMNSSFYDLSLITENNLFYQTKDLEEMIEAYLNGGIVPGEIDSLGFWKTLLSKDGNQYTVGDKDSGNNISIFMKDEDVRFGVDGAEVKNDGLTIINKDVFENVFSQATANGVCYLPMTRYEELLEFLGTKLSEFENPSRFIEKEFNKKRRYNADFTDGTLNAYYDGIKYSTYQDGEIEQGVPNIEVEYEEGGSEIIADMMKGKVEPLYGLLVDTAYAFTEAEDSGLTEYFTKEKLDELSLYILNNSYEDVMKLYNDGGLIGYREYEDGVDERGDTMRVSERDYELTEISTGDDETTRFRFRKADRYGYYYEEMSDDLYNTFFNAVFLLPLELYHDIVSYDYQVIPATGFIIEDLGTDEVDLGGEPVSFLANVLPTMDGTGGTYSYATNNTITRIQSGEGRVAISRDQYEEQSRSISGVAEGEVSLIGITADGGFTDTITFTVVKSLATIGFGSNIQGGTFEGADGESIWSYDLYIGDTIYSSGDELYQGEPAGTHSLICKALPDGEGPVFTKRVINGNDAVDEVPITILGDTSAQAVWN